MFAHSQSPRRSHGAFTLVEILIVLAIVVLLAAILLPVFQRVRAKSYRTTCQSNLQQLGLALHQYVTDNGRRYPPTSSYSPAGDSKCIWVDRVMPYVKSVQLFKCPTHPGEEFRSSCAEPATGPDGNAYYSNGSYLINTPPPPYSSKGVHEVRLHNPSATILLIDARDDNRQGVSDSNILAGGVFNFNSRDDFPTHGIPDRHDGGNNVLYFDGHVKWRTLDSLLPHGQWRADGRDDLPVPP